MASPLGPLVRLDGLSVTQLPEGGHAPPTNTSTITSPESSLPSFITSIISESAPFIDGVAPKDGSASTWKSKGTPKRYSSTDGDVALLERVVSVNEIEQIKGINRNASRSQESWFCRLSRHKNRAVEKTASWDEFVHSFKDFHPETEDAFTPTIIGHRTGMVWDTTGMRVEAAGHVWQQITLSVVEMKHRITPKPLNDRTFPVLQLAASLADTREFLVVSIPIADFETSTHAEYAKDKSLVVGSYASIERIRLLEPADEIEWIMATTSNAGGNIPQWIQNMAVPGQVAHDVDMFMKWIPGQRTGKTSATQPTFNTFTISKKASFVKGLFVADSGSCRGVTAA